MLYVGPESEARPAKKLISGTAIQPIRFLAADMERDDGYIVDGPVCFVD